MCGVCATVHVGVRGQHGGWSKFSRSPSTWLFRTSGFDQTVSLPELLTHRSLRTTLISLTHFTLSQTSIFKIKALMIYFFFAIMWF